ncbi:MAG TPA: hypothetical protein VN605_12425 [Thermoanaerobaculia bacterium]|nr:hypothetical protein [Thermoanaerobaculia bacterium]
MFPDQSVRLRLANVLSIVGHPFVLVPATVALTVRTRVAVAIALVAMAAMLAVIARRVKRGEWSDYDVSDPRQRYGLYPVALAIVGASAIACWALSAAGLARGMAAAFAVLAVGAVLTRWTKVSLHMLIGTFCVVTLAGMDLRAAAALALLVAAVGWSRVALRRHTVAEVLLGGVVGAAGGVVLVVVNSIA